MNGRPVSSSHCSRLPAPAADDHEVCPDPVPAVQKSGDLAGGHPVPVGQRVEPYEGEVVVPDEIPFHGAADRVRAVEHEDALAVLGRGLHRVGHRPDVGVVARADVLDVEDERVESLEHLCLRPAGGPVEAVHRDPSLPVGDLDQVLLHGVEAVLRGEERRQRHLRQVGHHLPCVPERGIHRGRVRDQPDPESPEEPSHFREPVQPGLDSWRVHGGEITASGSSEVSPVARQRATVVGCHGACPAIPSRAEGKRP